MSTLFDLPFEEPEPEPAPEPEAPAPTPAPAIRQVFSVSELTATLRDVLETRFAEVWVEGELSNAKVWTTGHLYFTLKDGGSQIKGVMFRSALRYLKFKPEDGLHVIVRGRISVYDPKGEYQIVAEHMEPHGYGRLQLAFDQLKKKLAAEGLFDTARKRPLPALPRRIGIVTSIDGAALQRHHSRAPATLSQCASDHRAVASPGRGLRRRDRPRAPSDRAHPRRRRRHRRPRRRLARGSLGVQRGEGRARDRGMPGAGDFRGRPRNRFHDCRLRRRPSGADAVRRRRIRRPAQGRVLRSHRQSVRSADAVAPQPAAAGSMRGCTRCSPGQGTRDNAAALRCAGATSPSSPPHSAGSPSGQSHAVRGGTISCVAR